MTLWQEVGRTCLAAFLPIIGAAVAFGLFRLWQVRRDARIEKTARRCRDYIEGRYEA